MIYFDNAATVGFRPRAVTETVENVIRYLSANPGRSGHRLSVTGAEMVYDCRKVLAEMFSATPDRVIFTKNCTEALNVALFGTLNKGGNVITTVYEHNSVLRPLFSLKEKGLITLTVVAPKKGEYFHKTLADAITPDTYMIAATAASNVTGEALCFSEIAALCKKHDLIFLCDGAQGCGHLPLSVGEYDKTVIAVAGHKGLYGIMGSGALIFGEGVEIEPLIFGGTGTESFNTSQPRCYPERLESGTLPLPAIASLSEGARYVKTNFKNFGDCLYSYTAALTDGLKSEKNVTLYSKPNRSGIVSFSIKDVPSAEAADILNKEYDVAVRGGLHCAPLIHKFLGTDKEGLVRASLAVQNGTREINYFIKAVKNIAKRRF